MGASGSGKSTLLTIAGSLEAPTSGEVIVEGAVLSKMRRNDQARMRRRSIGYVFQDYNLLAGLTAVENVSLPLELDGISAKKARAAGMAVLEELGLSPIGRRTSPTSCPVASANESRSPGRSSAIATCSWPMSPPGPSTRPTAKR